MKRRHELMVSFVLLLGSTLLAAGSGSAAWAELIDPATIDRSLQRALRFIVTAQAADGAWRATRYPALADGPSLTPLVLRSLQVHRQSPGVAGAWQRGIDYLVGLQPDTTMSEPSKALNYPLYTAAGAIVVLPAVYANRDPRAPWIEFVARRQLTESLGWQPGDGEFGGWSYSGALPSKPAAAAPRSPLEVANLSATVFAAEALRAAGRSADNPSIKQALQFVERCQNFAADVASETRFDDGGFFFVLDDATRNKAGIAGSDATGRVRFRSYASATADGLRALRLCGLPDNHPRVVAARDWLKQSLSQLTTAGTISSEANPWRASSLYYACWSLSLSLDAFTPTEAAILAGAVFEKQQPDGSWSNPAIDLREDECLVSTPLAIEALSRCRRRLTQR